MGRIRRLLGAALAISAAQAAAAGADTGEAGWSGEGALSAGATSGNTETVDAGLSIKLGFEAGRWEHAAEASFDYAEKEGKKSKSRAFAGYQLQRAFANRAFTFLRTSWEEDDFSGFERRAFVGVGLGYNVLDEERTRWAVQVAPGVKFDELRPAPATETSPAVLGGEQQNAGVEFGSKFKHDLTEALTVSNDTLLIYADVSTQTVNKLALTAQFTDSLSGRVSFEQRYDSDPPNLRDDTDTATRFGVVYEF